MEFKLKAELRANKEKLNKDFLPAVLYGNGIEARSLKVKKIDFDKVFSQAGESNLIELQVADEKIKVMVKSYQRHLLKHTISHVDFYQVNMKEKVTAEIPLNFINESKAVRELGGMLMRSINEIQVECLPADLVSEIDVDISVIEDFDTSICVKDLNVPKEMTVLKNNPDDVVVAVMRPKMKEGEDEGSEEVKKEGSAEGKAEEKTE